MDNRDLLLSVDEILDKEEELLRKRRKKLKLEDSTDKIGIALSGGGIRSATLNLGLLEAFNKKGLLKRADYLSSVSGGGYINSFVQNRLNSGISYGKLFEKDEIDRLCRYGDYLRPSKGIKKAYESITFYLSYIVLAMLHFIWYFLFFFGGVLSFLMLMQSFPTIDLKFYAAITTLSVFVLLWYYFMHPLRYISRYLWSSRVLYHLFALFALLWLVGYLSIFNIYVLPESMQIYANSSSLLDLMVTLLLLGYFSNPNILSMHRYYRFRIADAYLKGSDITVANLIKEGTTKSPYPLICSTLNIQADSKIKGQKSAEYYLFSPLYSGSKLTNYVFTASPLYNRLTLATAVTVSGAALNSMMGYKSNRFLSFILTLLNIRLGYWAINPLILEGRRFLDRLATFFLYNGFKALPTYWPYYNLAELFGKMNLSRWMINLSDGGGIENLGAYELFRRQVKVIICSDAGADPKYEFEDLRNLLLRVRNELEIAVEFSEGNRVEDEIFPKPSSGYSNRHYVVGRYYKLAKKGEEREFLGYFVYIKASVTAPKYKIDNIDRGEDYYAYKNHHPSFPHEPTTDQFFDKDQWRAYRALGLEIGESFLDGIEDCSKIDSIVDRIDSELLKTRREF